MSTGSRPIQFCLTVVQREAEVTAAITNSVFRAKWPLLEVTQVAQRPSACLVCAGGLEKPLKDASERC